MLLATQMTIAIQLIMIKLHSIYKLKVNAIVGIILKDLPNVIRYLGTQLD